MNNVVVLRSKQSAAVEPSGDVFADFEEHCKRHDWYYAMSDDYGVWCNGEKSRDRLLELFRAARAIDDARATTLFRQYAPPGCVIPT